MSEPLKFPRSFESVTMSSVPDAGKQAVQDWIRGQHVEPDKNAQLEYSPIYPLSKNQPFLAVFSGTYSNASHLQAFLLCGWLEDGVWQVCKVSDAFATIVSGEVRTTVQKRKQDLLAISSDEE